MVEMFKIEYRWGGRLGKKWYYEDRAVFTRQLAKHREHYANIMFAADVTTVTAYQLVNGQWEVYTG